MEYVFHFEVPLRNLPYLLSGAWLTMQITLVSILAGLVLGTGGAVAYSSRFRPLRFVVQAYVELIRNTPFLVQLYFIYFALPSLGIQVNALVSGLIALTVNAGAYCTEIIRAGMDTVSSGQIQAGMSLGMTRGQILRKIILPQAFRVIYAPLGNQVIQTLLGSSVISQISAQELTYYGALLESRTFRSFEIFGVVAIIYLCLSQVTDLIFKAVGRVLFRRKRGGRGRLEKPRINLPHSA